MHYHCEIWTRDNIANSDLSELLAPYDENIHPNGWFDWYQIGGRWKGCHSPGYDPEKDPTHIQVCSVCHGTGERPNGLREFGRGWHDSCNGCNGCRGSGKEVSWPTTWSPHEKDTIALSDLQVDLSCYTLIIALSPSPVVFHQKIWDGEKIENTGFDGKVLPKLKSHGIQRRGYLTTIDYHS